MKELVKVMKAASDPVRIKILKILEQKVMCVCEIHTILGIAQSSTSKHLRILEEAGLVSTYREGLWVNATLANGGQSPYASNLLGNLRHWINEDAEILSLTEKLPDIQRETICKR